MFFLDHWISKGVIQMDQEKTRSLVNWEVLKKKAGTVVKLDARSHFTYSKQLRRRESYHNQGRQHTSHNMGSSKANLVISKTEVNGVTSVKKLKASSRT